MKIIIAIPAYNEEKYLGHVIKDIQNVMDSTDYTYEILVTDDGSTDDTINVAKKAGASVARNKINLGLAKTFQVEMQECIKRKADIIIHTDADGQYPSKFIPDLIKKIEEGNDLVLGSRFDGGSYKGSLMKRIGNKAFASVIAKLTKAKITDSTTGFRAFTRDIAELELINNFTYTQEQLIRAAKAGYKIAEIPITTRKTRPSRLFANSFQYALKAWINIFRIYRDYDPLKFFGRVGLWFIAIGSVLGLYVVYRVWVFGSAGGVPRVVLSMLLILMGVQIGLFGFLADMNKK